MRAAPSFAEYVRSLELRVLISSATAADERRVFELTQRTNQFNTRGDRPSAEFVRAAISTGKVLVARVTDLFGDYGLCGVVFLSSSGETLRVERLLLSCRVLGRGVEEEIFDGLVARAGFEGFSMLEIAVSITKRNQPVRNFLDRLTAWSGIYSKETYRFTLDGLDSCPRQVDLHDDQPARIHTTRAIDWNAVADLTRTPSALAESLGLAVEKRSGVRGVLAVVSDVLGRPVSSEDNLFALGADSLRLVRIVARLRSEMGIDLRVADLLYRGDVADLIKLAACGVQVAEEDPSFLSQLDSLYEEDEPLA